MSSLTISLIAFGFVFGSTVLGLYLRRLIPEHHIDANSRETMKLAVGMIATLAALVLGLLISTAKSSFDEINSQLTKSAAKVVQLDRVLAQYGPETGDVRAQLKGGFTLATELLLSGDESRQAVLDTPQTVARLEGIQSKIRALTPGNDEQRALQAQALELSADLTSIRWLVLIQRGGGVPMPLVAVLVAWLSIVFAGWAMFAPRNFTANAMLFACSLCVCGAIFLLLEMDRPLTGYIRIPGGPMQEAVKRLGQ